MRTSGLWVALWLQLNEPNSSSGFIHLITHIIVLVPEAPFKSTKLLITVLSPCPFYLSVQLRFTYIFTVKEYIIKQKEQKSQLEL